MTLRFVGTDPNTGGEGSPAVWAAEETAHVILQGEEAAVLLNAVGTTERGPGARGGDSPARTSDRYPGPYGAGPVGGVRCR